MDRPIIGGEKLTKEFIITRLSNTLEINEDEWYFRAQKEGELAQWVGEGGWDSISDFLGDVGFTWQDIFNKWFFTWGGTTGAQHIDIME